MRQIISLSSDCCHTMPYYKKNMTTLFSAGHPQTVFIDAFDPENPLHRAGSSRPPSGPPLRKTLAMLPSFEISRPRKRIRTSSPSHFDLY